MKGLQNQWKLATVIISAVLLSACASKQYTVDETTNMFEEKSYSDWEPNEDSFERFELFYEGNVPTRMAISHQENGNKDIEEKLETSLGLQASDVLVIGSNFIGPVTPAEIFFSAFMLSGPTFGSTEMQYRQGIAQYQNHIIHDSVFLVSNETVDINTLNNGGVSKWQNLHIETKNRFLKVRNNYISFMESKGGQCDFDGKSDRWGYGSAAIRIHPLKQYEDGINCRFSDNKFIGAISETIIRKKDDDHFQIINMLTFISTIDGFATDFGKEMYKEPMWNSIYINEVHLPTLDRKVTLKSKNQPIDWIEKYKKGTFF